MMVSRANIARARRLLPVVVAVFLTVSVKAAPVNSTVESAVNAGEESRPPRSTAPFSFDSRAISSSSWRFTSIHPPTVNNGALLFPFLPRPYPSVPYFLLPIPPPFPSFPYFLLPLLLPPPSVNRDDYSRQRSTARMLRAGICGSADSGSADSGSADSASADSASAGRVSEEIVSEESVSGESEWVKKLGCHGPPCPAFGSCTARFPNVQACWNPHLVDEPDTEIAPPINCPLKQNSTALEKWRKGTGRAPFDETCSNRKDFNAHGATALQVMRLEDVFVTDSGVNLNRSHVFVRNGCWRFPEMAKYEANHMVHEVPAVFNWAHQPGNNFYHFLIELVPLFLVSAPLMASTLQHVPVLVKHKQVRWYEQLGAPLIGIPTDQIRLLPTFGNDLFHADVVYQPIYQDCDHPSRPLWRLLRRRHLLHPTGLPLFNPDWTYRSHRPLSLSEARSFPSDWVVVLAKRPEGQKRSMVNFREVEEEVVRRFGRERVVVFNGSLPILQARALLSRARLYIAAHGAALTNMIFMPEQSSVLEIRPEGCHATVFESLASACSLRYHLVLTKGDWFSPFVANVRSVAQVFDAVQARMRKEDGGGARLPFSAEHL
ncbi:unnamed protein product [Closterium sp. Naga37s-1]|nr:unnamed protein product [Closterium sp. Naga37s-1]